MILLWLCGSAANRRSVRRGTSLQPSRGRGLGYGILSACRNIPVVNGPLRALVGGEDVNPGYIIEGEGKKKRAAYLVPDTHRAIAKITRVWDRLALKIQSPCDPCRHLGYRGHRLVGTEGLYTPLHSVPM